MRARRHVPDGCGGPVDRDIRDAVPVIVARRADRRATVGRGRLPFPGASFAWARSQEGQLCHLGSLGLVVLAGYTAFAEPVQGGFDLRRPVLRSRPSAGRFHHRSDSNRGANIHGWTQRHADRARLGVGVLQVRSAIGRPARPGPLDIVRWFSIQPGACQHGVASGPIPVDSFAFVRTALGPHGFSVSSGELLSIVLSSSAPSLEGGGAQP